MELQSLREAHRQSIETLKQQSEQELQTLRFELEDEGKAMLGETRRPSEDRPHAAARGTCPHAAARGRVLTLPPGGVSLCNHGFYG